MDNQLQRAAAEIQKLTRHMGLTIDPLQADLNFAGTQLQKDRTNQFWRRTVIRCLLAVTEAVLWNMKHIAPQIASVSGVQLTSAELEVAHEERTVTVNGKRESRPKFPRFRDNVKATFSIFGKVHGVTTALNFDQGFDALCETYELRSRLMHPKKPFDPDVSDTNIATAQLGLNWFQREYLQLMDKCGQEVAKIAKSK